MRIKAIVAAAGAVLLATAGAAQAGGGLTATGGSGAEGFSVLTGVPADPMSIEDSADVHGRATVLEVVSGFGECCEGLPPSPVVGILGELMVVFNVDEGPGGSGFPGVGRPPR